jgi:hypothetical protein
MSIDFYTPSIFETNNARHKSPEEVALSFVPPIDIFEELATKNNHVLVGPRGSGKTTLLKMLTMRALCNWPQQVDLLPKTTFVGIFVTADNSWHAQINDDSSGGTLSVGYSAFTTHILMAFIQALIDIRDMDEDRRVVLSNAPSSVNADQETQLVKIIADGWGVEPSILNFDGLKLALRRRLLNLKDIKIRSKLSKDVDTFLLQEAPYVTKHFKDCISYAIDAYETITGGFAGAWAFLFDEFEIAPKKIQEEVLQSMRGEEDGRLLFKVALAPYNETFIDTFSSHQSDPTHDYRVVPLWHFDKNSGTEFSENLIRKLFVDEGINVDTFRSALGSSAFDGEIDTEAYGPDGYITAIFYNLYDIDPSFKNYADEKDIKTKLDNWGGVSTAQKASIRKLRSVAITRNLFFKLVADESGEKKIQKRSRKGEIRHISYAGYPTIIDICEGNPRSLINMFSPIARDLKRLRQSSAKKKVSKQAQAEKIRYAANSFRALLKTREYKTETEAPRSLLKLLDMIGGFFSDQCLGEVFHPEPKLSFVVPAHLDENLKQTLARALNSGAIIYVPDASADPILNSLSGKRFRLNYLLAAYYQIPILLSAEVPLNSILNSDIKESDNLNLFSEEDDS